jgi:hypothetical protein
VLTVARHDTATEAARAFFEPTSVVPGPQWRRNFYEFQAETANGSQVRGMAGFIDHRGTVIRLLGYSTSADYVSYRDAITRSLGSFGELRDRRYLDVEPARIEIVELPRAMGFAEFLERYPSTAEASEVAIINGLEGGETLERGRLMKRVVGGTLPKR